MTRVARRCQWTTGACYHVFNRGHNRDILFPDDQSRFIFLDLLQRYQKRFPNTSTPISPARTLLPSLGRWYSSS